MRADGTPLTARKHSMESSDAATVDKLWFAALLSLLWRAAIDERISFSDVIRPERWQLMAICVPIGLTPFPPPMGETESSPH